jgi:hypothetical protein
MAKIVKYTAQQGLQPSSMPNTQVTDPTNAALQNLGGQISNVADYFQQREEKKEDFKAENDYRRLNMELGQQMEDAAANMTEDGSGFHDGFMKNTYGPARDKFLAGLPDRLREKYGTILADGTGSDTTSWSIKGATKERDKLWSWYDNELKVGQDELQTAISMDPDAYDDLLKNGMDAIDASGLPETRKEEQRQAWTRMAQIAHLNRMIETQPERVLRDLGANPSMLTPTSQFSLLSNAVQGVETGGEVDPDAAVSKAGAIGRMQVMPRTAVDISKWMGDGLISKDMSDERIASIISNPTVNKKYGDFYLKKMIQTYSKKGGLEAALIAYNGGPKRAEEWIASGFDDKVLPKETREYYKKVMKQLPSMYAGGEPGKGPGGAPVPKGDPAGVKLVFADRPGIAGIVRGQEEDAVNPDTVNRVKTAFAGLGINKVKINSGYRDPAYNKAKGGAKNSEHVHRNAMDIDVSGYSTAERVQIINALSAAGITGLGIGANIIHADTGGRRAWGYATSAGGGAVPKWAQAAIATHLEGKSAAPNKPIAVGGRYAGLPYADRQKYINAADAALTQQSNQQSKATALQKVEIKTAMDNEIATLSTTGQSSGLVDDTAVSTILGEDDYFKWIERRETAQRSFLAKDGIAGMTLQEMDERLGEYRPDPGSANFASDQKVEAAVQKEIDRVTKLRTSKPTEAALLFPEVKAAWDKVQEQENPAPEAVQEFVRLNLEKQKEFGLKPGSEQPIPRPWAVEIGKALSKIPELQGRNKPDVNAAILVLYDNLQKSFGEYTDEVIINALREYKGVGAGTAELLTGYMQGIQEGGDPLARLRARQSQALDRDQVEESTGKGFWGTTWDFIRGDRSEQLAEGEPALPVDAGAETVVNDEQVLRAMATLENLGDEMSPEQEQSLVRRYGQKTVDAAKARISGTGP